MAVTIDQVMDLIQKRKMEQVKVLKDDEKAMELTQIKWGVAFGKEKALAELYREIMDMEKGE